MDSLSCRALAVVFAVGLLACPGRTMAVPADAQELAKAQDSLPSADAVSADELRKNYGRRQFTPFGDSKFYFEIFSPNGWESHLSEVDPDQLAHDTEGPVPMAEFAPSGADDVGVQVLYLRVKGDRPLAKILDTFVQQNNGKVVTRQSVEVKGRKMEEALMSTTADDLGPILTRVALFQRGDIAYILSGWSVEEKYDKFKRLFAAVEASFEPGAK